LNDIRFEIVGFFFCGAATACLCANTLTLAHCSGFVFQVCPEFLPPEREFRKQYKKPIEEGRRKGASQSQRKRMLKQSTTLKLFLRPIVHRVSDQDMAKSLPKKLEVILVLRMPRALDDLYRLTLEAVRVPSP
jgi:hypothetical protein